MTVLGASSSLLAEKYEQSVEVMKNLQMPPIGEYVTEAGNRASEKIVMMSTSALGMFSWLRWPSFNFTWNGGHSRSSVLNQFFVSSGGGEKEKIIQEKIVERVVVHDWSAADLSGLREELKKELKTYVDGLIVEKERKWNGQPRSLSNEEVENLMNLLLEKLRAGGYFKLDLTQENFRAIFLEMRQRFLDDNEVFVGRLVTQIQGSLDLSSWDEKLEALRTMVLGVKNDLGVMDKDLARVKSVMATQEDLKGLKEALMAYINEMIKQKVTEIVSVQLLRNKEEQVVATGGSGGDPPKGTVSLANEDEVRRLISGALKVYDADKTGLADYALESSGGQVLSTRCTENYHTKSAQISVFGIPLWYPSNTPRTAIQPNVLPGNCWAFQGFPGFLGELRISNHLMVKWSLIHLFPFFCSSSIKYGDFCHWLHNGAYPQITVERSD